MLRAGLLVSGSGEDQLECSGDIGAGLCTDSDSDYDHNIAFLLGADFLWTVGSVVRLGARASIRHDL